MPTDTPTIAAEAPAAAPAAPVAPTSDPAAQAAAEPAKAPKVNPFKRVATVAPKAAPAPQATPAPATPPKAKVPSSRVLALREAELTKLRPVAAEVEAYRKEFATIAKAEIEKAPAEWQKMAKSVAGDDPRKQVAFLRSARETGALRDPLPTPAQTTPPSAPKASTADDEDVSAAKKYASMAKTPQAAARYLIQNSAAIKRGQAKLRA